MKCSFKDFILTLRGNFYTNIGDFLNSVVNTAVRLSESSYLKGKRFYDSRNPYIFGSEFEVTVDDEYDKLIDRIDFDAILSKEEDDFEMRDAYERDMEYLFHLDCIRQRNELFDDDLSELPF